MAYGLFSLVWGGYALLSLGDSAMFSFWVALARWVRPLLVGFGLLGLACLPQGNPRVGNGLGFLALLSLLTYGLLDATVCLIFYSQHRAALQPQQAEATMGLAETEEATLLPRPGVWNGLEWLAYLVGVVACCLSGIFLGFAFDVINPPSMFPASMFLAPVALLGSLVAFPLLHPFLGMKRLCLLSLLCLLGTAGYWKGQGPTPVPLTLVKSNLKNTATALEIYASDHGGRYPTNLEILTHGNYLKSIPIEPGTVLDYEVRQKPDGFTLTCRGRFRERQGDGPWTVDSQERSLLYTAERGLLDPTP